MRAVVSLAVLLAACTLACGSSSARQDGSGSSGGGVARRRAVLQTPTLTVNANCSADEAALRAAREQVRGAQPR